MTNEISIHAPLAGCDGRDVICATIFLDFNPRTPCGVRRIDNSLFVRGRVISIHAPLAGCDSPFRLPRCRYAHFNPRTPCGVRQISFA